MEKFIEGQEIKILRQRYIVYQGCHFKTSPYNEAKEHLPPNSAKSMQCKKL